MSSYDKETWQAELAERDVAQAAYRDKMARARARSAANAKRKISRLHAKLTELGHISDFEDEFGESVVERLDKYGSAFHDREKGRAGDALSIAQKQVVARMNKKVKELKAKQAEAQHSATKGDLHDGFDPDADYVRTADRWKNEIRKKNWRNKGGFKSKRKSAFKPRIRNIEDELIEDIPLPRPINPAPPKLVSSAENLAPKTRVEPYSPEYRAASPSRVPQRDQVMKQLEPSGPQHPFLRIVPKTVS